MKYKYILPIVLLIFAALNFIAGDKITAWGLVICGQLWVFEQRIESLLKNNPR